MTYLALGNQYQVMLSLIFFITTSMYHFYPRAEFILNEYPNTMSNVKSLHIKFDFLSLLLFVISEVPYMLKNKKML